MVFGAYAGARNEVRMMATIPQTLSATTRTSIAVMANVFPSWILFGSPACRTQASIIFQIKYANKSANIAGMSTLMKSMISFTSPEYVVGV